MRFSPELIGELKQILLEQCGVEYSDEEAQTAGIAIVRFVIVKRQREAEKLVTKGNVYEKLSSEKSTSK
jgi:hypothetical protein